MFCPQCGYENPNQARFCIECGTGISDQSGTMQAPQPTQTTDSFNLKSVHPYSINLHSVMMYSVKNSILVMRLDGTWGDSEFYYGSPGDLHDDYTKIFEELQRITGNNVMWFNAKERPAVVITRITNVYFNDWWKRIELDIAGVGKYWVEYENEAALHNDYNTLTHMLANRQY